MQFDCQTCGGCCGYSNDWPEFVIDDDGDGVPDEFIDFDNGRMKCIGDRCSALVGEIGSEVSCSVYENRPSVCREFQSGEDGCKQVRQWFRMTLAA